MKTKMIFGDEHLINCYYGEMKDGCSCSMDEHEYDCEDGEIYKCYCFNNNQFVNYFIDKYPGHLASIAQRDKDIKEIYGK